MDWLLRADWLLPADRLLFEAGVLVADGVADGDAEAAVVVRTVGAILGNTDAG